MTENHRVLLVLPTYDEIDNISNVIGRVFAASNEIDVLVIDDSSPDGTGAVVRSIAAENRRVTLVERPAKLGLGSAYVCGFLYAIEHGYEFVCTMDADGSHDPAALPAMIASLGSGGLAIGSRYVRGAATEQPAGRWLLSVAANALARTLLDLPVRDCTSGYRVYSTQTLGRLDIPQLRSRGYSMLVELLCHIVERGDVVTEVPIVFRARHSGESKVASREIVESLRTVARLRRGRFGNIRTKMANWAYKLATQRPR